MECSEATAGRSLLSLRESGWANRINARPADGAQWVRKSPRPSYQPWWSSRWWSVCSGEWPAASLAATVLQKRFNGDTPYALACGVKSSSIFA